MKLSRIYVYRRSYGSISHGMQLDETTWLKSTGNQHKICTSCDHMGQGYIELRHSSRFIRVHLLKLLNLLLELFLPGSLIDTDAGIVI